MLHVKRQVMPGKKKLENGKWKENQFSVFHPEFFSMSQIKY